MLNFKTTSLLDASYSSWIGQLSDHEQEALGRVGNILKTEDFDSTDGVLERVEALKAEWAEARLVQVCANGTPLFAIELKRA